MFADRREESKRATDNVSEGAQIDHFISCEKIATFLPTDTLLLIMIDGCCYQIKMI